VGAAAVQQFEELSADFVVIESGENQLGQLKDKGYLHINGDATHEDVLDDAGIKSARGLLSLLNEDPDNIHQTIHDLSLEMQRAVIGMRRDSCDLLMPDDQTQLLSGDRILVLDEGSDEMECAFPGQKKGRQLVIIDDNPVIVKLYTRKSFTF
jgi:Trk K+ transport system NAD-binding subunit